MVADFREEIRLLLNAHGLSMKDVSLRAGLGETFVRDMLKRGREPSAPNLEAVRRAIDELVLGAAPPSRPSQELRPAEVQLSTARLPKDVPVLGTAAASALGKGAFTLYGDPVDYVTRPPGLIAARGIYALYVENESMLPRYANGELIYVNPFRPVSIEDYVVIQEPVIGVENEWTAFIKQLTRKTAEWIITRQFNPPAEVRFKNSPGIRLHKVMDWNELFGI